MNAIPAPLVLVVISGPQASGKSTLATALSRELRQRDERVALVELDQIAAMALPTLPSWAEAHHIFESTVGLWARTDLTCVIAEGSGSADEVSRLLNLAPSGALVLTIATTVPFETAFARAQADPTRGISKDREFLTGVYQRWNDELARIDPDVVIDTRDLAVGQGVERVAAAIESARQCDVMDSSGPPPLDDDLRRLIRLLAALENAVWNDMVASNGIRVIRRALSLTALSAETAMVVPSESTGLDEINRDLREELNRLNQRLRHETGDI